MTRPVTDPASRAPASVPANAAGVLVVDDEKTYRFTLAEGLRDQGFRAFEAECGAEAFEHLRNEAIDVVLLDLRLEESGEDGLVVLRSIKRDYPEVEVVIVTAHASYDTAVEAVKAGCYHFIEKSGRHDHVRMVVQGAMESKSLRREVEVLKHQQRSRFAPDRVIGESREIRDVLSMVDKIAPSRATVLLYGETGSGKEVIAAAIHDRSDVAGGPFVAVNCSAVPENLLESELFGHEKGAFTDASTRKLGVFELAHGGTLFLDEIGDMAEGLQAKLLRVLETGSFRRLGGTSDIEVMVRVIAATNKNLREEVAERRFREDLYYRLAVVPIHIPPLRERGQDILLLAEYFLDRFNRELNGGIPCFTPEAEQAMLAYRWPGNVRELRNVVERAVLLAGQGGIDLSALPHEVLDGESRAPSAHPPASAGSVVSLAEAERVTIERALREYGGNKTRAAEALGISRQTLRSKMKDYGLADPPAGA